MKKLSQKLLSGALLMGLAMPVSAMAADQDLQQKVDSLTKMVNDLKQEVTQTKKKSLGQWLQISGDYMFRYDYLKGNSPSYYPFYPSFTPAVGGSPATATGFIGAGPSTSYMPIKTATPTSPYALYYNPGGALPSETVHNYDLYSHRFGLNLNAKPTQDVTFAARLLMYKAWGNQTDSVLQSGNTTYSFDRSGFFDGTIGHLPGSSLLDVDRVYVDWENIAGEPIWFSVGRRPSTDGVPTHLKNDEKRPGVGGIPAILVNYAFDGSTLGWAPDIEALPGAYGKICYGRGFSTGLSDSRGAGTSLKDTDMLGVQVTPYSTDAFQLMVQYNRAFHIFDAPQMLTGPFSQILTGPKTNLGDIDWYGVSLLGEVKHVGSGSFNWFAQAAYDVTHANGNTLKLYNPYDPTGQSYIDTSAGLLGNNMGNGINSTNGWAVFAGFRYDYNPTLTKLGFEFNHGSENWITFAPAEDDMWTTKVGTRGNVYEGYIIQELPVKPISSYFSKVFVRVGYQYYDFDYTGSNSWLGAPVDVNNLSNPMNPNPQLTAPLKNAQDLYATFEVHF